MNTEVYSVVVDDMGDISVLGLEKDGQNNYIVEDTARIHGNLLFKKINSITKNPINGAEFVLTGTSEYGNDVFLHVSAEGEDAGKNELGEVRIDDLELGTYQMTETAAKEGYILNKTVWTVKVDERGIVTLYNEEGKEVERNQSGVYQIDNEPLHSIRFVKSSSYGDNIFLAGAEFSLNGVSDYGTNTNKTAVSGSDGMVVIEGLEPGNYQLKETKAPAEHEINTTVYNVKVEWDGSFAIEGLEKTSIGSAQVYEFKNVKSTGTAKIVKIWKDGKNNDTREIPNMFLATEKPSKNPKGYSITFDANGGTFTEDRETNVIVYSENGTMVEGTYQKPDYTDRVFVGWYIKSSEGKAYSLTEDGMPTETLSQDITVYAHYLSTIQYAVAIYGIGVDDMEDGSKGGLTFGPAKGNKDTVRFSLSHQATGVTDNGNKHHCVHEDTWAEIIEWNQKDPFVYEQCIEKGCTHRVDINKQTTTTILSDANYYAAYKGDGPGALGCELWQEGSIENLVWQLNYGSWPKDGWGASRIRAMLNGADNLTDTGTENCKVDYLHKSADIYTEENCLLATFPEELQDAIGKRVVKYEAVNKDGQVELQRSCDKLWLLSTNEIAKNLNAEFNHPEEGKIYPTFYKNGIYSGAFAGNYDRKIYTNNNITGGGADIYGTINGYSWLRSIHNSRHNNAFFPLALSNNDYALQVLLPQDMNGKVSPCFTLSRRQNSQ